MEFFGADRDLRSVTPGDADAWLHWLSERYAPGTTGRTVKRAKQFFRAAVRSRLVSENPFQDVKPPSQVNRARQFFVTPEMAARVLEACPDAEWRLIFPLCRYGGLRCPSELLRLKWEDVLWDRGRFCVHSPKKEHLECGGVRWVPIFPELRSYLEEAFEQAAPGAIYVISRYRDTNANLRTCLLKIIRRAGLTPWPKLFVNLRATRETELAAIYPIHVVCAWIGNSEAVAAKHYLQVTEGDFERAATGAAESDAGARQKAVQQAAAASRTESPETTQARISPGLALDPATPCEVVPCTKVPLVGLEPTTR